MADLRRGACYGMADPTFATDDPFYEGDEDSTVKGKRDPKDYTEAAKVCARCLLTAECLADALTETVQWGYRAGMTGEQRQALKTRGKAAPKQRGAPTEADLERRMALYSQGFNDAEIGAQLGITDKTVTAWRKRNSLMPNYLPGKPHTPEQQLMKRQAYDAGLTDAAIAAYAGVKINSIKKWRARFGLPVNPARQKVPA